MKKIFIIILLSFFICSCSKHAIKHSIPASNIQFDKSHILTIQSFKDERPEEERTGKTGEFLKFASKDNHFKKSITQHLEETFEEEFLNAGLVIYPYNEAQKECYHYTLSGSVLHYHAALKLPKTTVVPYLKQVTSIWSKDQFIIVIGIEINLINNVTGEVLIDKTYVFSEDKKLPTGLFSLARYSRGFNYKLKLLDKALSSVIEDIRDDVLNAIKDV